MAPGNGGVIEKYGKKVKGNGRGGGEKGEKGKRRGVVPGARNYNFTFPPMEPFLMGGVS